jgi:pyruvate, water dikinase
MSADPSRLVSWFSDIDLTHRPSVGGKGASLGELTRAGIDVPPGFVVTTAAFEQLLGAIDPAGAIRQAIAALAGAELAAIAAATAQIRQRILEAPLPDEVQQTLASAYRRLCEGAPLQPVAVRSSATSEDSAAASFAGLQDTLLWMRSLEEVERALRACWASLYSSESVNYRLRLKMPEQQVAMGVVVQRMVDSHCSGVMFTRSPTSGDRSVMTIEASWGLGSAIVSGEVTPDRFVVSKVTGEVTKRDISMKAAEHVPDVAAGGVRVLSVPPERQGIACLSDAQIAQLVQIGKRVERHYGSAQDIEWAVSRGDEHGERVYLLQSRPETVWASREAKPVAQPKSRAFDHLLASFSGRNR